MTLSEAADLVRDKALILAAMDYRSGADSCGSVYLGSMATAGLYHALGLRYGRDDFRAALEAADAAATAKVKALCQNVIDHMQAHPTAECPACGQVAEPLSCEAQHALAERLAADVGYQLTPEPEHPDSPHARRPLDTAPRDGTPIYIHQRRVFRFLPYRKGSEQLRKGIKGRWQEHTGYGFENCAEPNGEWEPVTQAPAAQGEASNG